MGKGFLGGVVAVYRRDTGGGRNYTGKELKARDGGMWRSLGPQRSTSEEARLGPELELVERFELFRFRMRGGRAEQAVRVPNTPIASAYRNGPVSIFFTF
jgi:hypothetical protein